MAGQWRIRHKLLLGLGLVVALVALLLGGALKGLTSYWTTIATFDNNLVNLNYAIDLRTATRALAERGGPSGRELRTLAVKTEAVRAKLTAYEKKLKDTAQYGHEPDRSYKETAQLEGMDQNLRALTKAIEEKSKNSALRVYDGTTKPAPEDAVIDAVINEKIPALDKSAEDIVEILIDDCNKRREIAKTDARLSLTVVLSTSGVGVLLMACLLRFFYSWVFYPIRDLQQGVKRVGQGDFDHTIKLHSSDELQDLAAAFNDMTARLRDIYGDLERQVNERSRQLVRSERLAGVGFLAAGVAHEINNPLASIAFCSEALERRMAAVLEEAGRRGGVAADDAQVVIKYLHMMQEEAFRCKKITQRLLEFSRGGERRREATDLNELIQSVLDVVQHLQNCKGKKLAYEPPGRLVAWINADEVKQVVLNLVVNALDSMDDGGTLTIRLRQRDGMAEMVFQDSGCGMTAEVLENIFEPFFTRSRTGKGTGLGLSISHRIISQHRGEIEAVSPGPNQGSTFTVRLPVRSIEETAAGSREGAVADREQEQAAEQDWAQHRKRAA
ncbi:MAG TPA: HAMP domain-containing sensor histidine kinase [Gemmataceae bacterium]|nr:HAMP domain-containing sensor histidine kinase [Gemmataceae bacterium]